MKYFFLLFLLFFQFFSYKHEVLAALSAEERDIRFQCLDTIYSKLRPYANLPGIRGHLEHAMLEMVEAKGKKVFYFDSESQHYPGKKIRYIITPNGEEFLCSYDAEIKSSSLKINISATLQDGNTDLLLKKSYFNRRSGIKCEKILIQGSASYLVEGKYIGLLNEFYSEHVAATAAEDAKSASRNKDLDPDAYLAPFLSDASCGANRQHRKRILAKRRAIRATWESEVLAAHVSRAIFRNKVRRRAREEGATTESLK